MCGGGGQVVLSLVCVVEGGSGCTVTSVCVVEGGSGCTVTTVCDGGGGVSGFHFKWIITYPYCINSCFWEGWGKG